MNGNETDRVLKMERETIHALGRMQATLEAILSEIKMLRENHLSLSARVTTVERTQDQRSHMVTDFIEYKAKVDSIDRKLVFYTGLAIGASTVLQFIFKNWQGLKEAL